MEQFNTALKPLPVHIWLRFTPTQAKGDPRGPTVAPHQSALGTGNAFVPWGSPLSPRSTRKHREVGVKSR